MSASAAALDEDEAALLCAEVPAKTHKMRGREGRGGEVMVAWGEMGKLTWATWRARVVAGIRRRGLGYQQLAGARRALRDDINAAALRIIHDPLAFVPVDKRRWHRRLHSQAGEINVAAALDEQLRIAKNFSTRHCKTAQYK